MTKKLTSSILILFAIVLIPLTTVGQNVGIRVANQVVQGQRFTVSITVTNGEAKISRSDAPTLPGCTLLAGPALSTMQSVQIINGRQSSSVTREYTFTYTADKSGTITVPAIEVTVDDKKVQTQPKTVTILPPDQAVQRHNSFGNGFLQDFDEMEELMNELMGGGNNRRQPAQPQPAPTSKISPNDFIVTVNMSKSDIYEKEAVVATIKLYTKHNITKFQPVVMPQFEGFLSEEIDVSNQRPEQEHFRGENYYTIVLKKCLLYPQKAGKLTINSGTYDVTLQTVDYVSNGYYATPVPREHNITTTSNSLTVNVKPLPSPVPASFAGAVGHFDVTSELVPSQLRTNEAAKYVLKVTGTGNLKHLGEPIVPLPATVEEYTPTGESDARFNGSNMQGSYVATYTFVPQVVGPLNIPSWDFTYFNPSSGKYVTVTLPAYEVNVSKGIGSSSAPAASSTVNSGAIRDIRHIVRVNEDSLQMRPNHIFDSFAYWSAYLLCILALVLAVIIYRRHIKSMADVQGRKIRRARSVASKRLNKARAAMNAHQSEQFYAAVSSALWGFLSDKLKMPASALTRDNIAGTLHENGASENLIEKTIGLLDDCEMARFTPVHSDTEMSTIYSLASEVIDNLNRIKPSVKTKSPAEARSRYAQQ